MCSICMYIRIIYVTCMMFLHIQIIHVNCITSKSGPPPGMPCRGLEAYLATLQSLEYLSLENCPELSAKGIEDLQSALPNCSILY